VEVGAAHPTKSHFHLHLARAADGLFDVPNVHVALSASEFDDGFHREVAVIFRVD
jgi:hypothetical protein